MFILGLKQMAHPRTAVRGNLLGAAAMLLAIVVTLFDPDVESFLWVVIGLGIGAVVGGVLAHPRPAEEFLRHQIEIARVIQPDADVAVVQ